MVWKIKVRCGKDMASRPGGLEQSSSEAEVLTELLCLCIDKWREAGRDVGGERGGQEQARAGEMEEESRMERGGP